jgi:hypothetical protein
MRGHRGLLCVSFICLLVGLMATAQALAAEEPPYEFNALLSLTGSCKTTKSDPIPDPGCPEKKPPQPFANLRAITVDSFGDEYVASFGREGADGRIDVFSPEGVFITEIKDEFGPLDVAVDSEGNLYSFDELPGHKAKLARYSPTAYKPAEGEIKYSEVRSELAEIPTAGGVAIDRSNDHVFFAASTGIREYSSAAEGNKLEATITNPRLVAATFVTVDAKRRRLYSSSCPESIIECWVLVFNADAPHELLKEVKGTETAEGRFKSQQSWLSTAVNEKTGDFFVGDLQGTSNVYQFNSEYELVSTLEQSSSLFEGGEPFQIGFSNAESAFNYEYLFVPSRREGRALAYSPPIEELPPVVEGLAVSGVSEKEAELSATVEPKSATTTYRFEYLTEEEWVEAGESFAGAKVAGEGTIQTVEQKAEVKAAISDLEPGTAYRVRISAENEVGPAEPEEIAFTTYADAPIATECSEAIRSTYSTLLPDCRAYELVTPADTNGRPPKGVGFSGDQFPTVETSPVGNTVSFLTEGGIIPGLGGAGGLNGDLYRAARGSDGWSSESAGASGAESNSPNPGSTSPDQGYSFWVATREGSAVINGEETHYVRYPDGHSALIGRGSEGTDPQARGRLITENGKHIVFETQTIGKHQPIQLEPDAPPAGTAVVYDRTADEVTHVVSLLPGDITPNAGENAKYVGASPDGEGIAFKIGSQLYLRVGNATTYEIGEGIEFAGVSEGGKRIFYVEGGDLFAFDTASEEAVRFTETGNAVPVNVSSDGTRAYFVSTTAVAGSGENPNGAVTEEGKDEEGKPKENLYLSEEGTIRFVGTVTERDVAGETGAGNVQIDGLGLWSSALVEGQPTKDPSRTNPDGTVLLFSSRADLDGYAHPGTAELYRYDSTGNRLHCISCIPTRTPAGGGASLESFAPNSGRPEPFSASGFVENLRADGKRAFFQSTEALVSRDNDETQDVYEWEEQGEGSCNRPGGCVYLISSGRSEKPNYLYALSETGDDAFFTTSDVLAGGDNNTVSIYDARVNGGFAETSEEICLGESCRGSLTPPPLPLEPVSKALPQPEPPPPGKPCPKGKHKATRNGKKVCVRNKKHHKKHHAKKKGRAGK